MPGAIAKMDDEDEGFADDILSLNSTKLEHAKPAVGTVKSSMVESKASLGVSKHSSSIPMSPLDERSLNAKSTV